MKQKCRNVKKSHTLTKRAWLVVQTSDAVTAKRGQQTGCHNSTTAQRLIRNHKILDLRKQQNSVACSHEAKPGEQKRS
jgi:hypothetical protein